MENGKSIHLQIEHRVMNFEGWREAFQSDPIDRKKSGVRRYNIFRLHGDPNYVIVDLEFDNLKDAEDTLAALRQLWVQVEGKIMINPQTRILNLIEMADV